MEESPFDEDSIALLNELIDLRKLHYPQAEEPSWETLQHCAPDCFTGLGDDSALGKAFTSSSGPSAPVHKPTAPVALARLNGSASRLAYNDYTPVLTPCKAPSVHVYVTAASVAQVQHNGSAMQLADFIHLDPMISANGTSAPLHKPTTSMEMPVCISTALGDIARHNLPAYHRLARDGLCAEGILPNDTLPAFRLPEASTTSDHHSQSASLLTSDCYFPQSPPHSLDTKANAASQFEQHNNVDAGPLAICWNFPGSHQAPTSGFSLPASASKNIFCAPDLPNPGDTCRLTPALNFLFCAANMQVGDGRSTSPCSYHPNNKDVNVTGKSPEKKRKPRERKTSLRPPVTPRKPLAKPTMLKRQSWRRCKY